MNKLAFILDKIQDIRDILGGDAFNNVPDKEFEDVSLLLAEIEDEVGEVRDDGEFEFDEF